MRTMSRKHAPQNVVDKEAKQRKKKENKYGEACNMLYLDIMWTSFLCQGRVFLEDNHHRSIIQRICDL